MTYETVIVGVDFSDESEIAINQAMAVARHAGARVVLVHAEAIPEHPLGVPDSMSPTVAAYEGQLTQRLHADRERFAEIRARHEGQGTEVSTLVVEGFPDTGICDAAKELGADLVVVGTHGRTGIKRLFLGSVAERVVRMCPTRVLVAREGREVYRKILVATDYSASAHRVLESAVAVAGPSAQIDLLYCWDLPLLTTTPYMTKAAREKLIAPLRADILATAESRANNLIEQFAERNANITASAVMSPPSDGIHDRAEEGDYDLIVIGSHGRRGARRWLLGSVAESTVRHAPCSVLVVHGGDAGD